MIQEVIPVRHASSENTELPGQDSFLDVVTNIVGILILLVMVMGVRASRSMDDDAALQEFAEAAVPLVDERELSEAVHAAVSSQRDVDRLFHRAVSVHQEADLREQERAFLNTVVVAAEREFQDRRAQLGADQQRDFALRERLLNAQLELDQLTREQIAVLSREPQIEIVECLPTPLGKNTAGKEVYILINQGHAVFVPVEDLFQALQAEVERNQWRLRDQSSFSGRIGPIEGFRLKYRFARVAFGQQTAAGLIQAGYRLRLVRWELVPEDSVMGEPVAQAALPSSELMRRIRAFQPDTTPVVITAYANSFSDYNTLRRALFDLGYGTAAHPLPDGVPVCGSDKTDTEYVTD
jgi:Na+-transporting methylmalonyl-CoA/oxaloacetate decarboxylase gamma subunit